MGYYATTGIVLELIETAKSAVRNIIVHLTSHIKAQPNYGRRPTVLCSVAANLKMNEVVDQPNWNILLLHAAEGVRAEVPPAFETAQMKRGAFLEEKFSSRGFFAKEKADMMI